MIPNRLSTTAALARIFIGALVGFVLVFSVHSLHAQSNAAVSFKRYGVSDGLSSNVAYAVAQDHLGFMWFGTNDGLNRFDGHTYVHYKNTADSSSLSNNTVRCIFRDGKNRLWIGTDGGLNLYNHLTNTFQRFRHHPASKNSLSSDYVSSICESRDGKIYVGTYDGGLNVVDAESKLITRLDATSAPRSVNALAADQTGVVWIGSSEGLFALNPNGQFQPFPHQPGNDNSPSGNDILSLYVDAQNTVWIGINGAWLNAYEPSSKTFTRLQIADAAKDGAYGLFSAFALVEDHQKQLWVGTFGGGLYAVDRYAKKFTAYRFNVGDPTSLGNNKVRSLFVNKGGSLWVGTERGVNSFSRSRVKFTTSRVDFSDPSLANNNVNALCEDRLGNVWIGVYGGLNLVNPNGDVIKTFGPADGLSSENVLSLVADGDVVWVGTESGVNAIDINTRRVIETLQSGNANSLSNNYIAALALGKDGALWIGTKGGGLNRYDHRTEAFTAYRKSQNGLSNDNVRCLFVDPAGAVWIGTDDGLNKFDPSTKAFTVFKHDPNDANTMGHNAVNAVAGDASGVLWLGTAQGLSSFSNNAFARYTDYMPDPTVYGILVDDQNNVWCSTGRGLVHLTPGQPNVVRTYDERDGLQNRYNAGAVAKTRGGVLLFGGNDGYNAVAPGRINHNSHQPNTVITSFKISDKEYNDPDSALQFKRVIVLDYSRNALSFEFAALDFVLPEKNRFTYKLEGVDDDWKDAGSRRYASYTNLDPGTYTFLVSGTNNDNLSNVTPASITVVIKPPFWKTWWFSMLAVVAAAAAVSVYIGMRTRRLRLHNKELATKVEERTAELKTEKEKVEHKSAELEKTLNHLRETQAQLVQSEKMASLGQLTAGIAHEIKNPLNFVNNFALLSAELIDDIAAEPDAAEKETMMQDLKKNLEKINHHGKRADSIVQSMLQHSRGASAEKQPVDINKLCDEYMDLAFHGMKATVQNFSCALVKNFDPKLPPVNAVPQEVSRVVLNLLNNAFYAVKEKPDAKVEVSTANGDGFVRINVKDNGSGMPEEIKNKIFEPFFTTKPAGQGTGLGLSLSFDIIQAHGGEIKVESEAGKGTEFVVSIPVTS